MKVIGWFGCMALFIFQFFFAVPELWQASPGSASSLAWNSSVGRRQSPATLSFSAPPDQSSAVLHRPPPRFARTLEENKGVTWFRSTLRLHYILHELKWLKIIQVNYHLTRSLQQQTPSRPVKSQRDPPHFGNLILQVLHQSSSGPQLKLVATDEVNVEGGIRGHGTNKSLENQKTVVSTTPNSRDIIHLGMLESIWIKMQTFWHLRIDTTRGVATL